MELAQSLRKMLQKKGKEAYIILLDDVSPELLMPFPDLEAFIITACPRIAIDDANMYKNPFNSRGAFNSP